MIYLHRIGVSAALHEDLLKMHIELFVGTMAVRGCCAIRNFSVNMAIYSYAPGVWEPTL